MFVGIHRLTRLSLLGACVLAPQLLFAGELTGVRLAAGPLSTRIVLDINQASDHKLFELSNPNRLVIDLPATDASPALRLPFPKGRVRSVRTGEQPGGVLRVVLDLTGPVESKSFLLNPDGEHSHRLVVDLSDASPGLTPPKVIAEPYTGRDVVIAIDAGHGGNDPGANGHGVTEKNVTLQIARRLASLVDELPGFRSVLIRDHDRYVGHAERLRIAHDARADLFLSIHADSVNDARVSGATVYTVATRRATSERARIVADRENAADLIGGVPISDKDDTLAGVLLRLSQEVAMSRSDMAGQSLIDSLSRVTKLRKRTVEQASFIVLTSPDIPSILVETAYITNAQDARNLRDAAFQDTLARALRAGIVNYFRSYAPPESYIARHPPAESNGPIRHVISRGETLSEIAERYRVSLPVLRQSNSISGDVIRIGQVLTIPTTG
jgi:N-acetylmuramoyl-L-alanine amidase